MVLLVGLVLQTVMLLMLLLLLLLMVVVVMTTARVVMTRLGVGMVMVRMVTVMMR